MKKALITGITGQDGAYLAKLLLEKGYEVYGGQRRSSLNELYRLGLLGITDKINLIPLEITEQNSVTEIVQTNQFDEIYNLAAQSFVGASWEAPIYTSNVDALAPLYFLEAIKRFSENTKFYQASTSEMFGLIQEPIQNEKTPFYPRSPYGVAKQFAHSMTVNYRESFNLFAASGILFNHESPLRGNEFVTKKITRQLVEVHKGDRDVVKLGNLDARRDWGYAPEYVVGMWRILQQQSAEDFVLATGVTSSVREFCNFAAEYLEYSLEWSGQGVDEVGFCSRSGKKLFAVDPKFYRPAEVDVLLGDASKAKAKLGWSANTSVRQLAEIMVNFDLK